MCVSLMFLSNTYFRALEVCKELQNIIALLRYVRLAFLYLVCLRFNVVLDESELRQQEVEVWELVALTLHKLFLHCTRLVVVPVLLFLLLK